MAAARIDERARTLSALFAATDWPEREQEPTPFGVHAQAASLRRHVASQRTHPAVAFLQRAFEEITRDPRPYFGLALHLAWPECTPDEGSTEYALALPELDAAELGEHMREFASAAGLQPYWAAHAPAWEAAVGEIGAHLEGVDLEAFLCSFFGNLNHDLVCIPNPLYPSQFALGIRTPATIYCLIHPRKAVGESPPWSYSADREHVLRLMVQEACEALLPSYLARHRDVVTATAGQAAELPFASTFRARYPDWEQQLEQLITFAAMALFLDLADPGAGDSFTFYEQRMRGLRALPVVVLLFKDYLEQQRAGKYAHVAEYLPRFVSDMKSTMRKFEML